MPHDPKLVALFVEAIRKWPTFGTHQGNATRLLDAIEAAGCVVVPVEPTLTQTFAGQEALLPDHPAMPGPATAQVTTGSFDKIYRAMVAARPGAQP